MKELCKRQVRSQNASEAAIRKYVREHHHHPDMGTLWALTSYLKRLEGFKVGSYEAQLKVKELERLYKLDEIRHLVPHLKAALEDQRVIVIIDELDKGWDSSEDAQASISGLFQACVSLNRLSPHLRAYISLRQELYDNTPSLYEDAQKYRDLIETICWTEADLQSLIARRLRYSVPRLAEASDARCWRTLFASTMDGEPGGLLPLHRRPDPAPAPRDDPLQRPVPAHRGVARQRVADGPGNDHRRRAGVLTRPHPRRRGRAAMFQYPDLLSVFEAFRGMPDTMERAELEFVALEVLAGEVVVGPRARRWLADHDEDALIEVLWRVGFLEAEVTRRPSGDVGSAYVPHHQCTNVNIRNVRRFRIHPMFRAYLGIRSGDDGE